MSNVRGFFEGGLCVNFSSQASLPLKRRKAINQTKHILKPNLMLREDPFCQVPSFTPKRKPVGSRHFSVVFSLKPCFFPRHQR